MWRAVSLAALGLGLVLCLAAAAWAESHESASTSPPVPKEWDQARVAELAGQLQQAADGLRESARDEPPDSVASGQSRARERYLDGLRTIENECRSLKREVDAGKGRDETLRAFEHVDMLSRDASEEARRMFLPQATIDKMQAARAVLEELRLYYTGEQDTRPGLVGSSRDDL